MTRRLHPNVPMTCGSLWERALEDGRTSLQNNLTGGDRTSLDRLRIVSIQL
jgi:hypothetical protein